MSQRVLIVANAVITNPEDLPPNIQAQAHRPHDVLVIAPIHTTRLQSWCSDIDEARNTATQRLHEISADIGTFREPPLTQVADEDQLAAVDDALAEFPADHCVVVTRLPNEQHRHERDIAQRIRDRHAIPTTTLFVDGNGRLAGAHAPEPIMAQ